MHSEGWMHYSVAERNILMDYGNIYDEPVFDAAEPTFAEPTYTVDDTAEHGKKKKRKKQKRKGQHPRFRIIDFGRTYFYEPEEHGNARMHEESSVAQLFGVTHYNTPDWLGERES